MNSKISIIIRSKNESFWINKCLLQIKNQSITNYEVILVDNNSKDKTVDIAKKIFPKIKIVNYKSKKFYPGKALNLGIKKSTGKYIAILSVHCIPKDSYWLKNLLRNLKNKKVAGVYGRQEPLDITSATNRRDLEYLFGLDKKIQKKDPFFHNANSMIKKSLWKKIKFDEKVLHIEDRIWSKKILDIGMQIIYEPNASVFHFHGVHHNNNTKRVDEIVKILEMQKLKKERNNKYICIIPINEFKIYKSDLAVNYILSSLQKIKKIEKIFIVSNKAKSKNLIKSKKIIFLHKAKNYNQNYVSLDFILKDIYIKKIKKNFYSTHIMVVEDLYPKTPVTFYKSLINKAESKKYFTGLMPIVKSSYLNIWRKDENKNKFFPIARTTLPSSVAKSNIFVEIEGIGSITNSKFFETYGRRCPDLKLFEVNAKFLEKV